MRTIEQIQESNFLLLKQFIQNIRDYQNTDKVQEIKKIFNRKSYLKEYGTIRFGTNRQSGHTTGMLRCLWEIPYRNILYLVHQNDAIKNIKRIIQNLNLGQIIHPVKGIIPITMPESINSFQKIEYNLWNSNLNKYNEMIIDLIIVDCHSFMPTTKEDELYNYACQWNTELLVFLE